MSVNWKRWARYARAKLDATVADGERELDRREAELAARAADKPWLSSSGEAPTLDEIKARIEHDARPDPATPPAPGPGAPPAFTPPTTGGTAPESPRPAPEPQAIEGFDLAAQKEAADARLAAIRAELGLGGDEPPAASS